MADKKSSGKKGGFVLTPITLSEPVKPTDGFTNLIEPAAEKETTEPKEEKQGTREPAAKEKEEQKAAVADTSVLSKEEKTGPKQKSKEMGRQQRAEGEKPVGETSLTEKELLRILDAESLDEIYELTDVLRASSLKLYATLVGLADSRGRTRIKNHELMSKAGIKGIATLYKQERWLMDLKLLEKKAKPGPHDGSSYVVRKLQSLPLPDEIYDKFDEYLSNLK